MVPHSVYMKGEKMRFIAYVPYEELTTVVIDPSLQEIGFELNTGESHFISFVCTCIGRMLGMRDAIYDVMSSFYPKCPFVIVTENSVATECRINFIPQSTLMSPALLAHELTLPYPFGQRVLFHSNCLKRNPDGVFSARVVSLSREYLCEFFDQPEHWGSKNSSEYIALNAAVPMSLFAEYDVLALTDGGRAKVRPKSIVFPHQALQPIANDPQSVLLRFFKQSDKRLRLVKIVFRFPSIETTHMFITTFRYCVEEIILEQLELARK